MTDPTVTESLRSSVVATVVRSIAALTFLLYLAAIVLIGFDRDVPGELWLAAGNASGALLTLLANSKGTPTEPVPVTTLPGDAVATEEL